MEKTFDEKTDEDGPLLY